MKKEKKITIALIFLIILILLIRPGLGLILKTNHPILKVDSDSMSHPENFNSWFNSTAFCKGNVCTQQKYYEELKITKEDFLGFPYSEGLEKGDSIIIKKEDMYKIGDLIVFHKNDSKIVHRIIKINELENKTTYTTKGDKNIISLDYEQKVPIENIIGKVIFKF